MQLTSILASVTTLLALATSTFASPTIDAREREREKNKLIKNCVDNEVLAKDAKI